MSAKIEEKERVRFHCPENDGFYGAGVYKPLDAEKQEIRLLKALRPDASDPDGPLRFELHQQVPLSSCKASPDADTYPFIAMSYRAGDPNDTMTITVNGRRFNAFKTLGQGLHQLLESLGRDQDNPELETVLYIWADQICINQSDPAEKATQVRMMRQIYEVCVWTYSWLGPDPQVGLGLRYMNWLAGLQSKLDDHQKEKKNGEPMEAPEKMTWAAICLESLDDMDINWECIELLVKSPYWYRGWICQEMTVSPDVSFNAAKLESDRAILGMAFRFLEMIRQFLRWNFDVKSGQLTTKGSRKWGPAVTAARVQPLRWLHEMDIGTFKFVLEANESWREKKGYSLDTLMNTARGGHVTDPADKVYAYLGLALPGYDIVPNYGPDQTLAKVYTEATLAYINLHHSLDILSFAEERTSDVGPQLPSWVSDWSTSQPAMSYWFRVQGDPRAPKASGGVAYEAELHPHDGQPNKILVVPCFPIDALPEGNASLSVGGPVNSYESWEHCIAAWATIAGLDIDRGSSETNDAVYPHLEENTMAVAFWATVYRGLVDPEKMQKMWQICEPGYQPPAEVEDAGEGEANEGGENEEKEGHEEGKEEEDVDKEDAEEDWVSASDEEETRDEEARKESAEKREGDPESGDQVEDDEKEKQTSPFIDNGSGLGEQHFKMSFVIDTSYIAKANWRFLRTEAGFFGLTKADAQPGDVIMVLMGADVPFLLRPCLDGYKLVGEVYVHGMMYGEIIEQQERAEDGQILASCVHIY